MVLTGMRVVACHKVEACQNVFFPCSNETTYVMQTNLLKVSEEGIHSLWMTRKTRTQNWDLAWVEQRPEGQEIGMYKECSDHSGEAHWLTQGLDVGVKEACSPLSFP